METVKFTLGRMLWETFRDAVKEVNFNGGNVEYLESSGYISRDFTVRASAEDMEKLRKLFRQMKQ